MTGVSRSGRGKAPTRPSPRFRESEPMSQETTTTSTNKTHGVSAADAGSACGADLVVAPLGAETAQAAYTGPELRLSEVDRRSGLDRRRKTAEEAGYAGPERRVKDRRDTTGLERRRGAGIRRTDERRAAEEGEMNTEQFEFVM